MKSLTSGIITTIAMGLLLGACSNTPPASNSSPSATTAASPAVMANNEKSPETKSKGGQVVESGPYHLELVPEPGTDSTHLDLYVQRGDTHAAIANAKVIAEVQLPNGQQQTMPFRYDATGQHYAAELSAKTPGQYQVKIAATIGSDKADGRFSFSR